MESHIHVRWFMLYLRSGGEQQVLLLSKLVQLKLNKNQYSSTHGSRAIFLPKIRLRREIVSIYL